MCKKEKGRGGKVCLRGKKVGGRNFTSMVFERIPKERDGNKNRKKDSESYIFPFHQLFMHSHIDSKTLLLLNRFHVGSAEL